MADSSASISRYLDGRPEMALCELNASGPSRRAALQAVCETRNFKSCVTIEMTKPTLHHRAAYDVHFVGSAPFESKLMNGTHAKTHHLAAFRLSKDVEAFGSNRHSPFKPQPEISKCCCTLTTIRHVSIGDSDTQPSPGNPMRVTIPFNCS